MAMLKPRSGAPRSQSFAICSSRATTWSSSEPTSATAVRYPAFRNRETDCRIFRIGRPSRLKRSVSTIASSPMYSARSPACSNRARDSRLTPSAASLSARSPANCTSMGSSVSTRLLLADRIPGDHQDAALDPVTDECRLLRVEQVLLVGSELEERQGVGTVFANELRGCAPQLRVRKVSRRSQRAEHDVRGRKEREQAGQLHGEPC